MGNQGKHIRYFFLVNGHAALFDQGFGIAFGFGNAHFYQQIRKGDLTIGKVRLADRPGRHFPGRGCAAEYRTRRALRLCCLLFAMNQLGDFIGQPLFDRVEGAALAGAIFISPYSYKIAPASPAEVAYATNVVALNGEMNSPCAR